MKAFVTGATGFIGGRVARQLAEGGHDVYALVRGASTDRAAPLIAHGIHVVPGDIGDPAALRAGMQGSDVVFHMAAWYRIGVRDTSQAQVINVEGTRNVLSVARELGIPRIVYTSTVAVFGDTHGYLADENYVMPGANAGRTPHFLTEYDRTKWLAHYKVALPMMREGLPLTIVMPGSAYGPGDQSLIGDLMRRFYLAQLPVLPGPETVLTYAHVDDIAAGHILAAERGRAGESYLLTGPALSFGAIFELWSEITGLPVPAVRVPAELLRPLAPLAAVVQQFVNLPEAFGAESLRTLGATYQGQATKARAELGWELHRPLRDGMAETFASIAARYGPPPEGWAARNRPALAGLAAASFLAYLAYRAGRPALRAGPEAQESLKK